MSDIALSLPFKIDAYGKVASTTDNSKIWADRVRSVIGTFLRERLMRPDFGTNIPFSAFNSQEDAENEIKSETSKAFLTQLPLLTLSSIETSFDEYTNIINVSITYDLPNNVTVNTSIGLAALQGTDPIIEENL